MVDVNGHPEHLMARFDAAFRALREQMDAAFPAVAPGVRSSHLRLLGLTPPDGLRLTDLAQRLRMTKQAAGELVALLQRTGHLEVVRDPADRRVRVVRPTAAGRALTSRVEAEIAALEQRCRAEVGPRRWDAFMAVLAELGRR